MKKQRAHTPPTTKTRQSAITTLFDLDMHGGESSREFLAVLNRSQRVIFQICLYFTDCQPASICDLYQEIACTLWQSWPTFRGYSTADTWVRRVALNVAVSEYTQSTGNMEGIGMSLLPGRKLGLYGLPWQRSRNTVLPEACQTIIMAVARLY